MPRLQRHVFVCINERPEGHPKGCCSDKGGKEVRELFKEGLARRGLKGIVRANAAGCLDTCALGVTVVVYPEAIWYRGVTTGDVEEIIEKHVVGGEVVQRLLMYPAETPDLPPLLHPARGEG
jgi:(2Fe-2S) ferredoxin